MSHAALAPLDGLGVIGLDELNAAAELQTRVDRKYILPAASLAAVLAELPADTSVLEVDGERAPRYASRYFDTPALDSFYGAARGRRRRFKVRARTYVDSATSFLEVKTRGGRSTTVKERVAVTGDALDAAGVAYAGALLPDAGIPRAGRLAAQLTPTLETRYRRVTLLLAPDAGRDPSRGTIDLALEWIDTDGATLRLPRSVIVETKSGSRAGALDRALWRYGHRPATLSKYATGLAALHPDLPRNKWRRVLDRHFADAAASALPPALSTAA